MLFQIGNTVHCSAIYIDDFKSNAGITNVNMHTFGEVLDKNNWL